MILILPLRLDRSEKKKTEKMYSAYTMKILQTIRRWNLRSYNRNNEWNTPMEMYSKLSLSFFVDFSFISSLPKKLIVNIHGYKNGHF